ncbi:DNA-binding transcriptional regulator YhcF (GntR family) [Clostridium tetanomorphum]|uniref:GntR family transcriptional regulator n=1 Tax=Clostridium tetanomorphum TaxID=1553 RepID=UPI0028BE2885|nr:GntR family transcriptional regulator [Clostridium tetanomorphum]MBP1863733.1 DNA-binding transcriptional regulator YhcF (GntR family) [Clostridium tetanomorphum]NRS86309.1 DNA-binding transcriptional regulator YhcF (GntR family) [Clostridium tetanomorphum]
MKKQIMDLIKDGSLKVGFKMLTERELSEKLQVSRNTVSMAYRELEQEGVLKSYQGRGTFVAEEVKLWKDEDIKDKIKKFVDLAFEEAIETGIDADEFLEIVTERIEEKRKLINEISGVYIECNIEQSKIFAAQLRERTNIDFIPMTVNDLKSMSMDIREAVQRSQIIITTFNHVNEVRRLTRSYNKKVLGVAITPDLETIVKIARFPMETRFSFICISEEFKFKVRDALESAGLGNIIITYTNSSDREELMEVIENSDVIITSPGRYKELYEINNGRRQIINFLYSLDDGSVKALKSKLLEIKYSK